MKKFFSIILIIIMMLSPAAVSAYDTQPAPDWVTVSLNPDASKTVAVKTPTYMIDKVDYYEYSTDGFLTFEELDSEGGEFVFDTTCEFSLRYYSSGILSETYTVEVVINKVTVITGDSTNISILIPHGSSVPADIKISAYEIINGTAYNFAANLMKSNSFRMYAVTVMRNNKVYTPEEPLNFLFPTESFETKYCKLYHMDERGNITVIESEPEMKMLACKTDLNGFFLVSEELAYRKGDVNGDGKVLANDARTTLRIAAKLETCTEDQLLAGDINNSGEIDASDARSILRASASLEKLD